MSVCGQNGQTEEDSGSEEVTAAAVRDIYKQKPASKVVRVLTVLAYLLSVSLAAILLSVYYVCVWKSPELPPLDGAGLSAQRTLARPRPYVPFERIRNITGGGDSGVNTVTDSAPANLTSMFVNASVAETSTDSALDDFTTETIFLPESLNTTYDSSTNDTDVT